MAHVVAVEEGQETRADVWAKYPRSWARLYMRTDAGEMFTWDDTPWMKVIWDDRCRLTDVQKCTQIGASMWASAKAVHLAAVLGKTVIYTLPTASDMQAFVSTRLDRMIDYSPVLVNLLGREGVVTPASQAGMPVHRTTPRDNVWVKQFGRGTLHLRGTTTARAAAAVPADALIHDEVDLSVPEIIDIYQHRLDRLPPEEWRIYALSTPTVAGYGINARYEQSCGYEWFVRCDGCNWWGPLDYWEHTGGYGTKLKCTRCGGVLNPALGEWVAARPALEGVHNGYKISRLMRVLPTKAGERLLTALHERRQRARFMRNFVNLDLGETSEEGAVRITREEILRHAFALPHYPLPPPPLWRAESGTGPYYMGVDQGDTLTVTVWRKDPRHEAGMMKLALAVRLSDPARGADAWGVRMSDGRLGVAGLMQAYGVRLCVVDGQPNGAQAHELAKNYPGRVLVCYYVDNSRTEVVESGDVKRAMQAANQPGMLPRGPLQMGRVDATTRVDLSVDRTLSLDQTAADLVGGILQLPGDPVSLPPEVEEFIRQCENNVRRPVEDKHGQVWFRWERTGPNDYFHSTNYARIAAEEAERSKMSSLGASAVPPLIRGATPGSTKR